MVSSNHDKKNDEHKQEEKTDNKSINVWSLKQYYNQSQLDTIHSYLVHTPWKSFLKSQMHQNADKKSENTETYERQDQHSLQNTDKFVSQFGFGEEYKYHELNPKYESLYDEIIHNEQCPLEQSDFDNSLTKAIKNHRIALTNNYYKTELICKYYDKRYNIIRNESISIKHILVLIIYTDLGAFCKSFRETYRKKSDNETRKQMMRRHLELYNYSRSLFESVQFFGQPMDSKMKVYHGLNVILYFSKFTETFKQPISTTTTFKVAQQFSNGIGIILELKSGVNKFTDLSRAPKYISVSWMSSFPSEDEKLFYGSSVVLRISNITEAENLQSHSKELSMFNMFQKTVQNEKIEWKNNNMLKALVILIKTQQEYGKKDFDYLIEYTEKYGKGWFKTLFVCFERFEQHSKNQQTMHIKNIIAVIDEYLKEQYEQYMTKYGKGLFDCFCRHPNTNTICIRNCNLLPQSLKDVLFCNENNQEQQISVIPILKLFPYVAEITLNEFDIKKMFSDSKTCLNIVLEYIKNVNALNKRYLKRISFKTEQQQDNLKVSFEDIIQHKNTQTLAKHKWIVEYKTENKVHDLTFINDDKKSEEKMRHLQLQQQKEEQRQHKLQQQKELKRQIDLLEKQHHQTQFQMKRQQKLQRQFYMQKQQLPQLYVQKKQTQIETVDNELNPLERINKTLGEYYQSQGVTTFYDDDTPDGKFLAYCVENGFEAEDIDDELANDAADCIYCDFDENFPIDSSVQILDEQQKLEEIFKVIKYCYEYGAHPTPTYISPINIELFVLSRDDLETTKKKYMEQCPIIFKAQERTLKEILAIGLKNDFAYISYLVDAYQRDRMMSDGNDMTAATWCKESKYFKKINSRSKQKAHIIQSAIETFMKRVVPRFHWKSSTKIQDEIKPIMKYIASAASFIHVIAQNQKQILPFGYDFVIFPKQMLTNMPNILVMPELSSSDDDGGDDDSGDDDSGDDDRVYVSRDGVNYVGFYDHDDKHKNYFLNIEDKLKHNNCTFISKSFKSNETRFLMDTFKEFSNKLAKDKYNDSKYNMENYPKQKRFCTLIDRRDEKSDSIIMFEPPDDCNTVPEEHVPEWYFNASKTCIVPAKKYGTNTYYDPQETICIDRAYKGQVITISFHVESSSVIRCYLFWNGCYIRMVYPVDWMVVAAAIFKVEYKTNKEYLNSQQFIDDVSKLEIVDATFEAFYQHLK
eukprot:238875_1